MFFSKVLLFAISFGAISVLATPHALHHHALHRRAAIAARVASSYSNSSDVTVKRQTSPKCKHRSSSTTPSSTPSSAPSSSIPAVTAIAKIPKSTPPPATTPSPTPTSTPQQPPPSTTTATQSPGTGGGGGGDSGSFSGDGTFFETGLGACGITNTDADFIVAVSEIRFDAASTGPDPNSNPLCNQKVSISFGGHTAIATIADRCTGCAKDSLDMTPDLFQVFASLEVGRLHNIVWHFIS